jgi:hypothetical protein
MPGRMKNVTGKLQEISLRYIKAELLSAHGHFRQRAQRNAQMGWHLFRQGQQ